jgi:hypothetical protein
MYTDDRNAYRKIFFDVWASHQKKLPLEPVESQVLDVILSHPEYHSMLEQRGKFMSQEFELEENPFFHMSLHIAVREQLQLDRPAGIRLAYQQLLSRHETAFAAEHIMVAMLGTVLHQAQQTGTPPDEQVYLHRLLEQA